MNDFPEIVLFDPTKKKKKKQKNKVEDDSLHILVNKFDVLSHHGTEDDEEGGVIQQSKCSWKESECDYLYKELLWRLFSSMHKNNPESAGDRQRTVLRPPQILSDGTMRTVFVNFVDLCKMMHRSPDHVKTYLLNEIGTIGSFDGDNRLVVEGRFAPSSFEDLLQRYINEYVLCNCCRSPDTIPTKERQILLLQCEMCGNEQSVQLSNASYSLPNTNVGRRKMTQFCSEQLIISAVYEC